jgi:MazG family protein
VIVAKIETLLEIMSRLRNPVGGCPWDIAQTFASVAPYTLEEAYEVADAIERHDMEGLKGELGDLLLQVVFHAQIAAEAGAFTFDDVVESICQKMVRRHPHVFENVAVESEDQLRQVWEMQKKAEREEKAKRNQPEGSVAANEGEASEKWLSGISSNLPGVTRAVKLQKRAATVGFDWRDHHAVVEKLHEELDELLYAVEHETADEIEDEMGDLLFVCTNIARKLGIDPEMALRRANRKFERRFGVIETLLEKREIPLDGAGIDLLDQLWREAKLQEGKVSQG